MRRLPALFLLLALTACRAVSTTAAPAEGTAAASTVNSAAVRGDPGRVGYGTALAPREGTALAAFSAGCFWGVEDAFRHVPGVVASAVGYTGGHTDAPTYASVCRHTTGHAETVLVEFDPGVVSYETLLNVFFKNHDPTTKDSQGPDVGDQYRSAIFTLSPAQDAAARAAKIRETATRKHEVVTEIGPLQRFWKAEEYHQQYDEKTGSHSCPMPQGLPTQGT